MLKVSCTASLVVREALLFSIFYHSSLPFFNGKSLIALVNKYAPEEVTPAKAAANGPAPVPGNILAAISAAVTVVTQGKGKVAKVEKI